MHAGTVLQDLLRRCIPTLHEKRLSVLIAAVDSCLRKRRLSLSELARGLASTTAVRHRIKRMDRLLGNGWLQEQRACFYRMLCRQLIATGSEPIILVDWSDLKPDRSLLLLRATLWTHRHALVSDRAFLDSNILIYAVSDDPRAARAQKIVEAAHVISVQVLNEFANVALRKLGRSPDEVRQATAGFRAALEVVPITLDLHDAALGISERHGFSFFDALIVATALEAGCGTLYTEDLQHRQVIGKQLRVVNPFV